MNIRIPSYREFRDHGKSRVYYTIEISYKDWSDTLEKRYSELLELHQMMKLRRRVLNHSIPHFPGKLIWKQILNKLSDGDIHKRKEDLEEYLKNLSQTDCASTSPYFTAFFDMPVQFQEEWLHDA